MKLTYVIESCGQLFDATSGAWRNRLEDATEYSSKEAAEEAIRLEDLAGDEARAVPWVSVALEAPSSDEDPVA